MECESPKLNMFCAISKRCMFAPFFFVDNSATGTVYQDMLENLLMPQLEDEEEEEFISQQDGAPPHWHLQVWSS